VFCGAGFVLHDLLIHKLDSAAIVGCGNFDNNNFVTKSHEYILVFKKCTGGIKQVRQQLVARPIDKVQIYFAAEVIEQQLQIAFHKFKLNVCETLASSSFGDK
jgi:hypothetical protein